MSRRPRDKQEAEYALPNLTWPPALLQPVRPPKLLYLDLNHWIELARADRGGGNVAYIELLEELRKAVQAGEVQIVLSAPLFREVSKITSLDQRIALRNLVEELSDFTYLPGLPDIFRLELQAVLNEKTETPGLNFSPVPLLGHTILHAMGRVGGMRIYEYGKDVTDRLVSEDPEWEGRLKRMEREAERSLFDGPHPDEVAKLREIGYQPEIPQERTRGNALFEKDWSDRIAQYRTSHQLRDLVIARHLSLELIDILTAELLARGLKLNELLSNPSAGRGLVLSMPASAVMVSLVAQYHQDPNKEWRQNDIYDIEALATAVPYCDIVFTDAAARDALIRRNLHTAMGTVIPRRPSELISEIQATRCI